MIHTYMSQDVLYWMVCGGPQTTLQHAQTHTNQHTNAPAGGGLVSGVTAWLLLNCVELKLVLPLLFPPVLGTGTATAGTNQSTAMASLLW
jgi:hypothetical protein